MTVTAKRQKATAKLRGNSPAQSRTVRKKPTPPVPSEFWEGLADLAAGRTVPMETALTVTRHGHEAVVMVAVDEFRPATVSRRLRSFFRRKPFLDDVPVKRDSSHVR